MKRDTILKNELVVFLLAMVCCLLWGSAFPCIKIGYKLFDIMSDDTWSQILYAGMRFFLAGMIAISIGSITAKKLLLPKGAAWVTVAKLSLFQTILQYLFFYIGLANTTGVKASIIEGVNVFVAILVASLGFRQERLTARKMVGCLAGFAGVVLVNLGGGGLSMTFRLTGEGFIFISTVAYAISSALLKRYSQKENTVMLSGWQFAFGGFVMMLVGFAGGGRIEGLRNLVQGSTGNSYLAAEGLLMLIYLGFVSAVAYSLWGLLLKYNQVSKISVYGFMNPVFGVVLSALLLSESNASAGVGRIAAALGLVGVGILIINTSGGSKA